MRFIREKKFKCGDNYQEVDIVPRTLDADNHVKKGKRAKRKKESEPKQRNLNQKNAKRFLRRLINSNFVDGDIYLTVTYKNEFLPETLEEAMNNTRNYLRRLKNLFNKNNAELKYILIHEGDNESKRIHHHLLIKAAENISRDDIEDLWTIKPKGEPRTKMGDANAKKISGGNDRLIRYFCKDPKGKKRWSSSRYLVRPLLLPPNDSKYRASKIEKLAKLPDQGEEYFTQKYKGYRITEINIQYYEMTGYHVYLKMWRE